MKIYNNRYSTALRARDSSKVVFFSFYYEAGILKIALWTPPFTAASNTTIEAYMENNPYKTPNSDVAINEIFKRSIWWKIYFFFITIISTFGMFSFLFHPQAGFVEIASLVIWLVATIGLFGFTFLKPIYKPGFWLQVLIAYLIFTVAYYFITDIDLKMGMIDAEFYISSAVGWLLSIPAYYALFAFSKATDPAWKKP